MTFTFHSMPRLETPRLILREIVVADISGLYSLFSDPEVTRYNDVETFQSVDDARDIYAFIQRRFDHREGLRWALALKSDPSERLIGTAGFNSWMRHNRCGEIGYDLMPTHWGQGLMTEAVNAMLHFGFTQMNLNRVEADVTIGNEGSRRVLVKAGFTEEGILRQRGYWKGGFVDLHFYSILREEYENIVAGS